MGFLGYFLNMGNACDNYVVQSVWEESEKI